ncbi:hypothetical protein [Paraburkholderia terrae]|uniref:hypothetical protein n=1 Tax=Paraburkholderia terrae TaxID=311230 RepID=UPI001319F41E|nr:hypothetical protein [Paraburkholderia terrae]
MDINRRYVRSFSAIRKTATAQITNSATTTSPKPSSPFSAAGRARARKAGTRTELTNLHDHQHIGLALVAESGDEFYAESSDFDPSRCSEFVQETVLPQLGTPVGRAMACVASHGAVMAWLLRSPVRDRPIRCCDNDVDLRIHESLMGDLLTGWEQENIWTRLNSGPEAFFANTAISIMRCGTPAQIWPASFKKRSAEPARFDDNG